MTVRTERGACVRLVLALVVAGAVLGLGWALLAPPLPVGVLPDGTTVALEPESGSRFDPVVAFVLASGALGLLSGALAWAWRRWRGVALLVSLVLGSLVAALVAEGVGLGVASLRYSDGVRAATPGSTLDAAPELGTWALVLVQPFAAALAHVVAVVLTAHDDLGRPPEAEVSSG